MTWLPNRPRRPAPRGRAALVWGVATLGLVLAGRGLVGLDVGAPWTAAGAGTPAGEAWATGLVATCAWVLLGCLAWAWVCVSAVALPLVAGRGPGRAAGCPALLRRVVLVACGVGLAATAASTAHAAAPASTPAQSTGAGALAGGLAGAPAATAVPVHAHDLVPGLPASLDGLRLPDRVESAPAAPRGTSGPDGARRAVHRVVAGESLWSIAADDLRRRAPVADPPDAAAIDAHWRAIHHLNEDVVGDDPDLVLPGQRLRLPTTHPSQGR